MALFAFKIMSRPIVGRVCRVIPLDRICFFHRRTPRNPTIPLRIQSQNGRDKCEATLTKQEKNIRPMEISYNRTNNEVATLKETPSLELTNFLGDEIVRLIKSYLISCRSTIGETREEDWDRAVRGKI